MQRFFDAGGGEIPLAATFRYDAPLLGGDNLRLSGGGTLVQEGGWDSGYGICSRDWTRPTRGWRIDGTQGLRLVVDRADAAPRKMLGLTYLDDFVIDRLTILFGGPPSPRNLFAGETRGCTNGVVRGVRLQHVANPSVGGDGWHLIDHGSDLLFDGVDILGADDAWSVTAEMGNFTNRIFQRITVRNSVLRARGFSGVKALLLPAGAASIIRDIAIIGSRIELPLTAPGAGVAWIVDNRNRSGGARIDGFTIRGGTTNVTVPAGGHPGSSLMLFNGIDRLLIERHRVRHWHRVAIDITDCPGAIVRDSDISPLRRKDAAGRELVPAQPILVPRPSTIRGVIDIHRSPGASARGNAITPGYVGQPATLFA